MSNAVQTPPLVVDQPAGNEPVERAEPRSPIGRLVRDPAFVASASIVVFVVAAALLADLIAPYDPLEQDLSNVLQGPGRDHWLGTDELGRDVVSRMLFAARVSLKASSLAVLVALVLGFPMGLFVGYRGGRVEALVMRGSDGLMAMPALIIVIAVIGVIGNGLVPAMVALGVVLSPVVLRLTRGIVLGLRQEPYIDAARVLGLRPRRVVVGHHLLPHVLPALIVQTSLLLGAALLIEAGLSFIGLGVQPPEAGWGSMLTKAAGLFRRQPLILVPPGVAITVTVLAFNVLGDTVRDALAPAPSDGSRSRRVTGSGPGRAGPAPPATPAGPGPPATLAGPGPPATLAVTGLTVVFQTERGPMVAVDDVSFEIRPGATLGLVGESGCGKTVTALAAMALLPGSAHVAGGSVRLAGTELVGLGERQLCRIRGNDVAMIFQDPASAFDPTYTVGNQISESLRVHRGLSKRAAESRAIELLDLVGIHNPRQTVRSYPHEFSGGMLQRVGIAAALACEPALLIADEPTTALDVTVQAEILGLLHDLQSTENMSILLVTHDLGVIAEMCEDVVVMYAGEVVESAPVRSVLSTPQHPYTQALLAAMPARAHKGAELPSIPGRVPTLHEMPLGCHFADRCPEARAVCRSQPIELEQVSSGQAARCLIPQGRLEP